MTQRKGKKRRWASATVEMAIVTPLLLTMLFGIIEYGWVFLRETGPGDGRPARVLARPHYRAPLKRTWNNALRTSSARWA